MPVEIKELIIRATVRQDDPGPPPEPAVRAGDGEREAIVEDCVRQVLQILRKSKER
jgi:hypothetical protein